MGFFDRLAFGWRLGTTSLGVVARDKTLMLFPVLSGIAGLLLVAVFVMGIGPEQLAALGKQLGDQQGRVQDEIPPLYVFLAFSLYFGLSFIAVYFNVALVGAAQQSIAGKDTVLGDGLRVANQHLGKIFVWAVLSGTVGLLLSWLESNKKIGGIVRSIVGAAWTVITYFVVPVMIFENQSPTGAVGRSVALMKQTWGENAGAQFGIGVVSFVLLLGLGVVCVGGAMLVPQLAIVLVPLLVLSVPVIVLVSMAAKAVLTVGLYEFATNTGSKGAFDPEQLKAAFR
jgi:hypothetical protein